VRHGLFIYEHDEELVEKIAPFLGSGSADGEPAVVVLERRKWELLAGLLGSDAARISFVDREAFLTRPEAAIAGFDGAFRRFVRDGASGIRVFGEPRWNVKVDWNSWISFEAILNRAFAHHPVWLMCGYDAREVPEPILDTAFETHPEVLADELEPNPHYHEPEDVVRSRTPRPAPLTGLHALLADDGRPRDFRRSLSAELGAAGVSALEAENMLIAAGEVLSNARRHGGNTVGVSVGRVGDRFVCEVSDDGPGIDNPLAGYLPPRPGHADGAGLWVARQLTRRLELVPSPRGSSVRLWV
jgi:anti-sigma regulatory factor (Ser/Thr protein kinase)